MKLNSNDETHSSLAFDTTLPHIETRPLEVERESYPISQGRCIHLYITNLSAPFVFIEQESIFIGRKAEPQNDLDLEPYRGKSLGVSRHHAEIIYKDGYYLVRDLGSANGTWINNQQIEPDRLEMLHNGDLLRIGYFPITVRFSFH